MSTFLFEMKTAKPIFDELNILNERIAADFNLEPEQRKEHKQDRIDEILDMLIMAYVFGTEDADEQLLVTESVVTEEMYASIWFDIADKDWEQRVSEYYDDPKATAEDIKRVVETDTNRIYNDAVNKVGEKTEANGTTVMKTWNTMLDDRVRDTHEYIEAVTIPFNEKFYTFDGDSARYPGDFSDPSNNINCRCEISLTRA